MSEDFAVQLSIKTPRDTLLNLRAKTTQEFEAVAAWALSNSARFIDLETAVKGVPPALSGNVTHVSVQQETVPNEPTTPAPSCMQGPKEFETGVAKSGRNAGKPWRAWDCPQGVCDREWIPWSWTARPARRSTAAP